MHRLLILGSLGEFVQLIHQAKARGIYTIVCDGYENGPGKAYGDKAYHMDVGETEKIAHMCREEKVDGIVTSFSDYLFESMVKIAEAADLPCYFDREHLSLYRNKKDMKDMLTFLGIHTPAYTSIRKNFQDDNLAGFHFPVVVKPVDKYGSRGVQVLDSLEEIRAHFDEACATSQMKEILVEEYHDGYEFNMMTWVLEGKVQVISIADREKSPVGAHEIPISSRNVYPSRLMGTVYEEAKDILQKVADYTGQREGPLSMQFFWKEGTPIQVCEVAGRFFGYEHELVEYAGGLNIEKLLLDYVYDKAAVKETFENYSPWFSRHSAVLYFHGKPGMIISNQKKAENLGQYLGTRENWLFYREGEEVVAHGPNPYVARYYITGADREEIDKITEHYFREMTIIDEKGEEVLYKNIMTVYPE